MHFPPKKDMFNERFNITCCWFRAILISSPAKSNPQLFPDGFRRCEGRRSAKVNRRFGRLLQVVRHGEAARMLFHDLDHQEVGYVYFTFFECFCCVRKAFSKNKCNYALVVITLL